MKFVSTRGQSPAVSFRRGPDPGPGPGWRAVHARALADACRCRPSMARSTLPEVADVMLQPFVDGDAIAAEIADITRDAFNFPGAAGCRRRADGRLSVLELFHGPTAAFKDFGARFLAACMQRLRRGCGPAAEHPGGHLGRHRRRGGRRVSSPSRHRGLGVVPQGAGVADPGAAAHLLGRQRAFLPRERQLR